MVWPPDSPWAPWWRTNRKVARAMCKLAEVGENDVVYDLGSGDGTTLIVAAKEFGARGVGIEIDPLRYFISSMLLRSNRLSDKVRIIRRNFFDVNISEASVVFVYLVPKALNRLLPKFNKELKKGTRIVSYKYPINLPMIKYDNENEIRLYMIS
jgi:predicted RNA methylase